METRRPSGHASWARGGVAFDRNVRWLLIGLVSVAICLVLSNVAFYFGRFGLGYEGLHVPALLDLDREWNLPTYFSSFMLVVVTGLSLRIGRLEWRTRSRDVAYWFVIAGAFFYVAVDEVAQLHERVMEPLRESFGFSGVFYFAWVVPAAVVLAAFGAICLRFVLRLGTRTRRLFVLAAVLYVGGAMGLELVGGYIFESQGFGSAMYIAVTTIEETLEFAGILVFLYALFDRLSVLDAGNSIAPAKGTSLSTTEPQNGRS